MVPFHAEGPSDIKEKQDQEWGNGCVLEQVALA